MSSRKKNIKRRISGTPDYQLFATTSAGLENVLAEELRQIRARDIKPVVRGVGFSGNLDTIYRANLRLRTAHRVLISLLEFEAWDRDSLYEGVRGVYWSDHLQVDQTLAVDAVTADSNLKHTQFISQVVKDAIVDGFRERTGRRPSVDLGSPDFRVNARIRSNRCTLSIDTSGHRLHRRGYRPTFGFSAPLKETLAAGILLLSGYDGSRPLIDPMCGSGTLLIEGALIAKNIAPGLLGRRFGFYGNPLFDRNLWNDIVEEARAEVRKEDDIFVIGSDSAEEAIRATRSAAVGAGVDDSIRVRRVPINELNPREGGMIVTNPPYGERLGEMEELAELYREIGDTLKHRCQGMTAHVMTSSKFLAGKIGLHAKRRDILWNGPLECRLLHFDLY